jgi:hypothetical protein
LSGSGGLAANCDGSDGFYVYTNSSGTSPLLLQVPQENSPAFLSGYDEDAADSVGVILDNVTSLTTDGSKLLSIRNAGTEKAFVDKDGSMSLGENIYGGRTTLYFGGIGNGELISGRLSEEADGPGLVLQGNNSAYYTTWPAVAIRDLTPNTAEGQDLCQFQTWQYGEGWIWTPVAGIKDDGGAWFNGKVDASAAGVKMWNHTPTHSNDTGPQGLTCYDSNYLYVWVDDDTVKRVSFEAGTW